MHLNKFVSVVPETKRVGWVCLCPAFRRSVGVRCLPARVECFVLSIQTLRPHTEIAHCEQQSIKAFTTPLESGMKPSAFS